MSCAEDKFAWLRDDEFARQAIAGVNPVGIERLTVFPPESKLDPEIYGDVSSALKEEHIIGHLHGMTVQQVIILHAVSGYSPNVNVTSSLLRRVLMFKIDFAGD